MTRPKSTPPAPQAAAEPAAPSAPSTSDVALVHRITPDGAVHVIRRRGDKLEAGALAPLREGAPISGEVVSLRPRANCPVLCDVDVLYTPPTTTAAADKAAALPSRRKGPAQVASDTYRDNWDSIWSAKKSDALN
jgi:hypothetical protein